jgi:hypothetical protein
LYSTTSAHASIKIVITFIKKQVFNYFTLIDTSRLNQKIKSGQFPFSQFLFWDAEINTIDIKVHQRYVIERVLTRGLLEDFYVLTQLYTKEEIKKALKQSKELDNKTIAFCSRYFNLPQSEMHASSFYH